jgi:hypothetical protein
MKKTISTNEMNKNYARQYSFSESDKDITSYLYRENKNASVGLPLSPKNENHQIIPTSNQLQNSSISTPLDNSDDLMYTSLDELQTTNIVKPNIFADMNRPFNRINTDNSINNDLNTINQITSTQIQQKPKKNLLTYILKKALLFIFHLLLISIFEIVFFFNVVVKYENTALYNLADEYINPIISSCQMLNQTDKIIFNDIFNYLVNVSSINHSGYTELNQINLYNNHIVLLAWTYVIVLSIIFLILLGLNVYFKHKIKIYKIVLDNIFMIACLGLYEYMFFNTIIIKYRNIDSSILTKYVVDKINNCSII